MLKISLAGFKDPVRRPRYLIWIGVVVLVLAAVVVTALGATCTFWFCATPCHVVQEDSCTGFQDSAHAELNCMSCHMPVNANPIIFVWHKMQSVTGLYAVLAKTWEAPLNAESHLAMDPHHMPEEQCTQCHTKNRVITPSEGIIIDHAVHSENEVTCSMCHNRVAHPEDFELQVTNPDGSPGHKHDDFMSMEACYRCHGFDSSAMATGECSACHPSDFKLKPANHTVAGFYPAGHAEMAYAEEERIAEYEAELAGEEVHEESHGLAVPSIDSVNYCETCHITDVFCANCHGMEMPHPEAFKTETHPNLAASKFDKCVLCHNPVETSFCDDCHHGEKVDWTFDPAIEWQTQHASAVTASGVAVCLEACHTMQFCSDCHTELNPYPTSHTAADWRLISSRDEFGGHVVAARAEIAACEVCHGEGGTSSAFCMSCHKLEVPHPSEFTEYHAATGRENSEVCAQCHTFPELCSDCHHEGAVSGTPWLQVHPNTIAADGAEDCFVRCHKDKNFCVACHNTLSVIPTSHTASDFLRRTSLDQPAGHPMAYDTSAATCTYCHGEGGTEASFCTNCHKIDIPHPADIETAHGEQIMGAEVARAVCENCHSAIFCNNCHHEGYSGTKPWQNEHPDHVKADGADPCFECHAPTSCSYCHVRLIH